MPEPRRSPYVWVTWLAKLMDDEQVPRCQWSAWFRAHYRDKWNDVFSADEQKAWRAKHDEMVNYQADELRRHGYRVYVESENYFKILFPSGAILAGQPDIVAVKGNDALVMDCKTGVQLDMHQYQLLLYMYFLPHAVKSYSGLPMSGVLMYQDGPVEVRRERLDESFERRARSLLTAIVGSAEPVRQPHPWGCRFCDVPLADCPDRDRTFLVEPVPFTMWDV